MAFLEEELPALVAKGASIGALLAPLWSFLHAGSDVLHSQ